MMALADKTYVDPNKPIWLVDDNAAHVLVMEQVLERSRLQNTSTPFSNGEKALAALTKMSPQDPGFPGLILLDVNMPEISGFEILSALRSNIRFRDAIIVMMSSSQRYEDRKKSIELGANDYLVKVARIQSYVDLVDSKFRN